MIVKGLTTPLSRWVQVVDCLCRYSVTCALSPTGLIRWFSKLREILTQLCCITLSSSRKKPMQDQEVARRISGAVAGEIHAKSSQDLISRQLANFWRHCRGDLRSSQDIPSTHHKLLSLTLHYLPFASCFPLPHFTFAILFALFRSPLFACFLFACVLD